ncbi:hypothetical protein PsYK624_026410 [Phanerochaete sordida]|uniref:Uncharacterized protein n=1 Tax=Phanerochaete sordida TaxID=48140 RepID=A0A9P3L8W3_9APHY|nr:hypothetical protein PsYK624_026410 [Phanerochaete sordida]
MPDTPFFPCMSFAKAFLVSYGRPWAQSMRQRGPRRCESYRPLDIPHVLRPCTRRDAPKPTCDLFVYRSMRGCRPLFSILSLEKISRRPTRAGAEPTIIAHPPAPQRS